MDESARSKRIRTDGLALRQY